MKIKDILDDGTVIRQYEEGDRVKILSTNGELFLERGDLAAIIDSFEGVFGFCVQTDKMAKAGWGDVELSGEYIEPAGYTKMQEPALIKAWKEKQIKKLIGA
jgi:hypothetical protein